MRAHKSEHFLVRYGSPRPFQTKSPPNIPGRTYVLKFFSLGHQPYNTHLAGLWTTFSFRSISPTPIRCRSSVGPTPFCSDTSPTSFQMARLGPTSFRDRGNVVSSSGVHFEGTGLWAPSGIVKVTSIGVCACCLNVSSHKGVLQSRLRSTQIILHLFYNLVWGAQLRQHYRFSTTEGPNRRSRSGTTPLAMNALIVTADSKFSASFACSYSLGVGSRWRHRTLGGPGELICARSATFG